MTVQIISAFAPIFALIALGYGVRASGWMPRALWSGVNALNHRLVLPAFLFTLLARTPLDDALGLMAVSALGSVLLIALAWTTARMLGRSPGERAALIALTTLWNLVLTLAIAERLLGPDSAGPGAAIVVPGVVIGAAVSVAAFAQAATGSMTLAASKISRDPVILACVLGLIVSTLGLADRVPALFTPLDMLGAGAMAIIVLSIGAGLDFPALRGRIGVLVTAALLRTVAGSVLFISLALLFQLDSDAVVIFAIAGAAPGAAFTYAVAADFNGETELMAGMLTLSVLFSALVSPIAAALALSL